MWITTSGICDNVDKENRRKIKKNKIQKEQNNVGICSQFISFPKEHHHLSSTLTLKNQTKFKTETATNHSISIFSS